MFKENKKLFYLLGGILILVVGLQYFLPKSIDFRRNYQSKNKSPFGCYALYNVMPEVYSENFKLNSETFYNLNQKKQTNSTLLIINDKIDFNKNDFASMNDFLSRGNTVFLAANDFNGLLKDSLHISAYNSYFNFSESLDTLLNRRGFDIRFFASNLKTKTYKYPQLANASHFIRFDSTLFKVAAVYDKNKVCLLKAKIGTGTLYLMSVPDVFGNYFIANHKNRTAAYSFLSMIKNENLIWDEFYKSYNVSNTSPIKFILESESLYAAYLLMIFTIIIYMIFEGRRRQRAIPIIEPVQNTTLEFINVISHVYYNSKSHKSIAVEKIKYFYESLRRRFNISTQEMNEKFYDELSELSGIEKKILKQLFLYCEKIKMAGQISEYELLELNRQIENFNKNSLR